jgi:trimeric autotransporter adhesin
LTPGNHTITIEVTGRRGAKSAQSWVWIDAFDVTGVGDGSSSGGTNGAFTRVEQDSGAIQKVGQWFTNVNGTHSGGTAILALDAGSQVRFTFTGTAVRWIGLKDNWAGIAKVFIDGVLQGEIDTYATTTQVKTVLFEIAGLAAGSHTITVETTGRKNAAAKSAWVWVDAFEFR